MLTSMQTHADQAACAKEVALIERARRVEIREAKIEQQRKRLRKKNICRLILMIR